MNDLVSFDTSATVKVATAPRNMELPSERPWPDYANPPVVETVLGVQFDRLPSLKNAHWGAFWASLDRSEWKHVDDAQPLQPQFEIFTEEARWAKEVDIHFSTDLTARVQFRNAASNRMIQLQNGRFHLNWLGQIGQAYPRYSKVREEFVELFDKFRSFCDSHELPALIPNQWEVTYVNIIPKNSVWAAPKDWGFFKALAPLPSFDGIIAGETFGGEWRFEIPDRRGRLHVHWNHGSGKLKGVDGVQEFVRLVFTARGKLPLGENLETLVISGLDLGHETIVRSFRNLMSNEANEYWGLKNGND